MSLLTPMITLLFHAKMAAVEKKNLVLSFTHSYTHTHSQLISAEHSPAGINSAYFLLVSEFPDEVSISGTGK